MKYIKFINKGLVNILDLCVIGNSIKRNDSQLIGEYGSGLKYTIAGLLCKQIPFKIYSGNTELKPYIGKLKNGNITKEVIFINEQATTYSPDLGHKWETWMYIRELLSNALDMKGSYEIVDYVIPPNKDETAVFVGINDVIQPIISNWHDYFADKTEVLTTVKYDITTAKVYASKSDKTKVFKNGILVYTTNKSSIFDYDIDDIDINEMRLVTDTYSLNKKIAHIWTNCTDKNAIKSFIEQSSCDRTFEADLDFTYKNFNSAWTDVLKELNGVNLSISDNKEDKTAVSSNLLIGLAKNSDKAGVNSAKQNKIFLYEDNTSIIEEPVSNDYESELVALSTIVKNISNYEVKLVYKTIHNDTYKIIPDKTNNTIIADFKRNITENDYWQLVRAIYQLQSTDLSYPWKLLTQEKLGIDVKTKQEFDNSSDDLPF